MKRKVLVAILQLGLSATDQWFTNRNLHGRGKMHEDNPVARPFTRNTLTLSLSSAAEVGAALYGEHWLHKRHHDRLAEAWAGGEIAGHAEGAIYSALQ